MSAGWQIPSDNPLPPLRQNRLKRLQAFHVLNQQALAVNEIEAASRVLFR
jgi:hypothetical protein